MLKNPNNVIFGYISVEYHLILPECGCFDYKPLTINHVAILDKELAQEIRIGNLTTPIYTYENCDYIYIQCGEENARTRQLLRTNWPDRGTIYVSFWKFLNSPLC